MRRIRNREATLSLPSLRLEGALFLPDQLEKAALGQAARQTEADYLTPKGLKLRDDYSRAFQIACAQWRHFAAGLERRDLDPARVTTDFVHELLRDALGYHSLSAVDGIPINERHYPITQLAAGVPVVIAPHTLGLDDLDARFAVRYLAGGGAGSRKKSAFQLAQEFLNASPDHLWGIVSNGKQLRLLRDAATLTRPSYLEVDLQDLLGGQRFAEFAMAWRLLHASRSPGFGGEWRTPNDREEANGEWRVVNNGGVRAPLTTHHSPLATHHSPLTELLHLGSLANRRSGAGHPRS